MPVLHLEDYDDYGRASTQAVSFRILPCASPSGLGLTREATVEETQSSGLGLLRPAGAPCSARRRSRGAPRPRDRDRRRRDMG